MTTNALLLAANAANLMTKPLSTSTPASVAPPHASPAPVHASPAPVHASSAPVHASSAPVHASPAPLRASSEMFHASPERFQASSASPRASSEMFHASPERFQASSASSLASPEMFQASSARSLTLCEKVQAVNAAPPHPTAATAMPRREPLVPFFLRLCLHSASGGIASGEIILYCQRRRGTASPQCVMVKPNGDNRELRALNFPRCAVNLFLTNN